MQLLKAEFNPELFNPVNLGYGHIFNDLLAEDLEQINKSKITSRYKRGMYVFYAANNPAGLFFVQKGLVRLESDGPCGNGHFLGIVQDGGILGHRSLFSGEVYDASAVVVDDATICFIPKPVILDLMKKVPKVTLRILSQVSKELRSAEERLCAQTDKNASERVAEALLLLKDTYCEQNWTRKDISEWAGTTPETVMRTLADFELQGLIEQNGRKITIVKREALRNMSNCK